MFRILTMSIALFFTYAVSQEDQVFAQSSNPIVGQLIDSVALRGIEDVHIEGEYVYLPCREGKRLTICSIANPAKPEIISTFTHPELGPASGFAMNDDILYLASQGNTKLLVVDARDKSALRLLGSVSVGSGIIYKIAYRDGYCFLAQQSEKKIYVIDVRNPRQPVVVATTEVTTEDDGPFSVLLKGHYALVGTIFGKHNRMAVVDIKDPTSPQLVTQVFDPEICQVSGEIVGNLLFTANWDTNAFIVYDIADVTHPKIVGKLVDERMGKPNRCAISGDRAYLPMVEGDGVAIIDISDPTHPQFLTSYRSHVMNKTYGVAIHGDLLLVGARKGNSLLLFNRQMLEPGN